MHQSRGFTLVEIAIVLVIVAMIVALFATVTSTLLSSQRRQTTVNHLAAVDNALIQFVVQNQRLPCPADGQIPAGAVGPPAPGTEGARVAAGCALQTRGVVPWVALGMGEQDATDGWGRRITYRVWDALTLDGGMNMTLCDPAGTGAAAAGGVCSACAAGAAMNTCTSPGNFLAGKGYSVRNVAGTVVMTPPSGAAYILISPGESGGGGYTTAGVIAPTTSSRDGDEEQLKNYADLVIQPYYVDSEISEIAGPTHFDDVVVRATVLNAATRAGLGPRAHP